MNYPCLIWSQWCKAQDKDNKVQDRLDRNNGSKVIIMWSCNFIDESHDNLVNISKKWCNFVKGLRTKTCSICDNKSEGKE